MHDVDYTANNHASHRHYDCYLNIPFPSSPTPDPRPLSKTNMACPLLNKLPPELRAKIYEYVLDFDDVPLRHITQLQPFVKKLTGVDGELPFSYEDPEERDPELKWMMIDGDELFGNTPIDTGVLATCKTIYTEGR